MQIEISGLAPHIDGTYELDWRSLTNRELHEIKRISGVRPAELLDATMHGDAAFACAMALTAVRRLPGKRLPEDMLLDSPGGTVKFVFPELDEEEGDSDDPPTSPQPKRQTKRRSSGSGSTKSSAKLAARPKPSGDRT